MGRCVAVLVLAACGRPGDGVGDATSLAGGSANAAAPASVRAVPAAAGQAVPSGRLGIGRHASAAEIRAWNVDVNPDGVGLPAGSGTYARGAAVYTGQCASCHGVRGEGLPPNPALIGGESRGFAFGDDPGLVKTIGNYWPYATTLYDYINRAMPFAAPGSLSSGDVYSVTAFLLAENGIIEKSMVLTATTLPAIRMPARNRFVPDDRAGGPIFR